MEDKDPYIQKLELENENLRQQLSDANQIIDSIREGAVDALVVNDGSGSPQIYAIESADYTYRILIEKFSEGALSINETGLILFANRSFSDLAGLPSEEILGTNFRDYFEVPTLFDALLSALQNGPAKAELSLSFSGKMLEVYLSLTDLNPMVPAIGIVITDLSEKKKQQQALLQYQEQLKTNIEELHLTNTNLEQVVHVISHDLKEPLRKILTYLSEISKKQGELLTDRDLKSLNIVNASAFRLNSLLDDIVKYAFTDVQESGAAVDLNFVIDEVVEDLEISIQENNATINVGNLPVISGSEVQMRQLLSNLISNAIKYRKTDDPVIRIEKIEAEDSDDGFVGISITDNGIGMEKNHFSQIFTIFKRLHHRGEYAGNGIGLAICKKIMDNHQGRISVDSTPGSGSTFSLYFPKKDQRH
ncbi:sensor histidine kinase [Flavobacterium selenitireducens]|uniref:sensor histidine kinase n=1 Tax=Flavobacterium selenitireducens TaxID=2722704 RepID=UPI00168B3851|nr:ATP-binding protein [Flavobacterium selenitireducens]MBD3583958.1 PAS domain-containing protein [Flavobacterium selenitireducens]